MLSATDHAWITDDSDAPQFPGGIRDLELREIPAPPTQVLAAVMALAPGMALKGHAAMAAERGRWGCWRARPLTSYVVRVAPACPGTAVALRVLAKVDNSRPPDQRTSWFRRFMSVAVIGMFAGVDPLLGLAVAPAIGWGLFNDLREGRQHNDLYHCKEPRLLDADLAIETYAWRCRFWEQLERELARRLAHRNTYRSPDS